VVVIQAFRRHARWLVLATAALVVAAACGGTASNTGSTSFKGTKEIGYSGPLTGQSQLYGQAVSRSLNLAADDINGQGGVNGYKLKMDIIDDGTLPDRAAANTRQLILQDNVAALIGDVTTAQCQATSPIAKQNKVLLVAVTCNSYQLTTEPDLVNPDYVSIVPNTYMEGIATGQLVGKAGAKRIFIVSPNYLFGVSETTAFVSEMKKLNPSAQIVNPQSTWYVPFPTNPDWHSTINAIQSYKPDFVYSNIFAADQINFVKQALQVDPDFFKKYPMTTLSSVDDLNALGSSYPIGMHLYMRAPFFALNNSKMADFVKRFHARYGDYPSDWAVMAYDGLQLYATAAKNAKSFDTQAVVKQIVGHSFQSLRGYAYKIRSGDQQANVGETIGTTASSNGKYTFPVLSPSSNLNGNSLIMPTNLMNELRSGQCEKGGDPKTTNFAFCPSWNG
jgi:branched-chain amino acid transport system substrate-binding protein